MSLEVPVSPAGPEGSALQLCSPADLKEILVLNCLRPFLGHAAVSRR